MDIVDFTFIPNHLDVQDCLPFELMPGYTLMNANEKWEAYSPLLVSYPIS
jgi:hypothetical protein